MNIDFKLGHKRSHSFDESETQYLRCHTFGLSAGAFGALAAGATAAVGAGVSMYGANKQAKANKAAQDQNAALQEEQNRSAWASYLMSRGVNPAGAKTGEIPTNPQAINAKLPLWASVRRSPQVSQGFRVGVRANAAPRLSASSQIFDNAESVSAQPKIMAPTSIPNGRY